MKRGSVIAWHNERKTRNDRAIEIWQSKQSKKGVVERSLSGEQPCVKVNTLMAIREDRPGSTPEIAPNSLKNTDSTDNSTGTFRLPDTETVQQPRVLKKKTTKKRDVTAARSRRTSCVGGEHYRSMYREIETKKRQKERQAVAIAGLKRFISKTGPMLGVSCLLLHRVLYCVRA
jgi:hypothetical protein